MASETYRFYDAWEAARVVAQAVNETTGSHGFSAEVGDRAPVVFVRGGGKGWSRKHGPDRFTFEEIYEAVDGRAELVGVQIAEVPQRHRAALVRVAEQALSAAQADSPLHHQHGDA